MTDTRQTATAAGARAQHATSASGERRADYRQKPYTPVHDGAIRKNEPGKVNIHPVTYRLNNLDISAKVYAPANYDPAKKTPAVAVAYPNRGVKEQAAGLCGQRLAEQGYVTIVADAAFQGASGRHSRSVDKPASRTGTYRGRRMSSHSTRTFARIDLRPIVAYDARGEPTGWGTLVQHTGDALAGERGVHFNGRAFPREVIHDGGRTEHPPSSSV